MHPFACLRAVSPPSGVERLNYATSLNSSSFRRRLRAVDWSPLDTRKMPLPTSATDLLQSCTCWIVVCPRSERFHVALRAPGYCLESEARVMERLTTPYELRGCGADALQVTSEFHGVACEAGDDRSWLGV
jgi:hypothetical protein